MVLVIMPVAFITYRRPATGRRFQLLLDDECAEGAMLGAGSTQVFWPIVIWDLLKPGATMERSSSHTRSPT